MTSAETSAETNEDCAHPASYIKVIFSAPGGTWSAVCIGCVSRWVRTPSAEPENVPETVQQALVAAANMAELDGDDRERLGLPRPGNSAAGKSD